MVLKSGGALGPIKYGRCNYSKAAVRKADIEQRRTTEDREEVLVGSGGVTCDENESRQGIRCFAMEVGYDAVRPGSGSV